MEANGRILNVPHYLNYPRPSTEAEESDQVGGGEEGDEEEAEDDIDLDLRKTSMLTKMMIWTPLELF